MTFPLTLFIISAAGLIAATYKAPTTALSPAIADWDAFASQQAADRAATGDYT